MHTAGWPHGSQQHHSGAFPATLEGNLGGGGLRRHRLHTSPYLSPFEGIPALEDPLTSLLLRERPGRKSRQRLSYGARAINLLSNIQRAAQTVLLSWSPAGGVHHKTGRVTVP